MALKDDVDRGKSYQKAMGGTLHVAIDDLGALQKRVPKTLLSY